MNTFQAQGPISARIELLSGDIRVSASDRTDVVVAIAPRDKGKPADVEATRTAHVEFVNDVLDLKTTKSWQRLTGPSKRDGSIVVNVELPSGSSLSAKTGMGFVHCEGELATTATESGIGDIRLDQVGELTAKTGFGDVVVDGIAKNAKVSTGTGTIRLRAIDGSAKVKNANGAVEVGECARTMQVRTSNGNIDIGRALSSVTAGSAAGDVRIAEVSAGSVTVRTGAGAIDIGIREGAAAWLEVNSKYGSVRNGLTSSAGPTESESRVEVRARTGVGDITINRARYFT